MLISGIDFFFVKLRKKECNTKILISLSLLFKRKKNLKKILPARHWICTFYSISDEFRIELEIFRNFELKMSNSNQLDIKNQSNMTSIVIKKAFLS